MMMMNLTTPLVEENWLLPTRGKYMKFVIYHSSTATEPRNTSNQKLVSFRKCTKREETLYPTLKDERYFDSFIRSLYTTAKSHECDEVLHPEYTHSNSEKELFEAKQIFMFLYWTSICLLTWEKPLLENMCLQLMHNLCGRIFKNI